MRGRTAKSTAGPGKAKVAVEEKEEDDEVAAPTSKRLRKGRRVVKDEDEDGDEPMEEAPPPPDTKKAEESSTTASSRKLDPEATVPMKTEAEGESPESPSEVEDEELQDEEEKPEVAAKARQKVQASLEAGVKHPYPDWKPGEPVPYAALCKTFSLIELTTKRLEIMAHCSLFLRQVLRLTPDDLLPTVLLMINKLAPDYAGIELGIGESLIMKAIGETTGRSLAVIKQDQKEIGDLGLVAVKSRSTQPTMFKPKALTIRAVHKGLMSIATMTGNGAQGRKVDSIKKLLSAADANSSGKVDITKDKGGPSEAKYLVRFLEGKLRLGLAEKTVIVSLAQAMVAHEAAQKGKVPSTSDIEKGESILKAVYRFVQFQKAILCLRSNGAQ
jgi:DNA ligase-1